VAHPRLASTQRNVQTGAAALAGEFGSTRQPLTMNPVLAKLVR